MKTSFFQNQRNVISKTVFILVMHLIVESLLTFGVSTGQKKMYMTDSKIQVSLFISQLVIMMHIIRTRMRSTRLILFCLNTIMLFPSLVLVSITLTGSKHSWFLGSLKKILKRRKKKSRKPKQRLHLVTQNSMDSLHILDMFNNMVWVQTCSKSSESLVLVIITPDQMTERSFISAIPISCSGMMQTIREDSISLILKILVQSLFRIHIISLKESTMKIRMQNFLILEILKTRL